MDRYACVTELDSSTYDNRQEWRVTIAVLPRNYGVGRVAAEARDLPPEAREALQAWLHETQVQGPVQ